MTTEAGIVRCFYSAIAAGDFENAKSLMGDEIEWIDVQPWGESDRDELVLLSSFIAQTLAERYGQGWSFQLRGSGALEVMQYVVVPFIEEGASFAPSPNAFREEGGKVVWLGTLTTIDGPSGEREDFGFAHIWTVKDRKIVGLRQFIYLPNPTPGSVQ